MTSNFLTKVVVPVQAMVQYSIKSDYDIHQLIYAIFSGDPRLRFSYDSKKAGDLVILVHHTIEAQSIPGIVVMTRDAPEFKDGATVYFRLDANPSINRARSNVRYVPESDLEKEAWLLKRDLGLEIIHLDMHFLDCRVGKGIMIPIYSFNGNARVIDSKKLMSAIASGVGRGKAFGAGMLQVRLA